VSMRNKNKELRTFEMKYSENRTQNCNPFTMALNGVVDAPVNGGVAMYRTSFFSETYVKENPHHQKMVLELQQEIDEQVLIVERCIALHGDIVPENMLPLHSKIIENFDKNFKEEIARLLPTRLFKRPTMSVPETPVHPSLSAMNLNATFSGSSPGLPGSHSSINLNNTVTSYSIPLPASSPPPPTSNPLPLLPNQTSSSSFASTPFGTATPFATANLSSINLNSTITSMNTTNLNNTVTSVTSPNLGRRSSLHNAELPPPLVPPPIIPPVQTGMAPPAILPKPPIGGIPIGGIPIGGVPLNLPPPVMPKLRKTASQPNLNDN